MRVDNFKKKVWQSIILLNSKTIPILYPVT